MVASESPAANTGGQDKQPGVCQREEGQNNSARKATEKGHKQQTDNEAENCTAVLWFLSKSP